MTRNVHYDQPFHWWGPGWDGHTIFEIDELLRDGTIDAATAAVLWAALARRFSLAVIGGEGGIGKSTVMTALCRFLPPDIRHVYLRGCFESFAFLRDPAIDPRRTALLINEISPHLPVYLWGPGVNRVLEVGRQGFTLLATAHGESIHEFVGSLTGSPLRIPAASLASFNLVAVLRPSTESANRGIVREVWSLRATRDGLAIEQLQPMKMTIQTDLRPDAETARPPFPGPEIVERQRLLCSLRDGLIADLPAEIDILAAARHALNASDDGLRHGAPP